MRTAVYMRVSTKQQDFIIQEENIKKFIELRKFDAPEYLWFKDFGFTGGNQERPAFKELMQKAFSREFDTIIIYKLSRLGRNLKEIIEASQEIGGYGINLISVTEHLDTTTAMGRAYFHLTALFDELQKDLQNELIKEKLQLLKDRGKKLGRPGLKDHEKKFIIEIKKNNPKYSIRKIKDVMYEKFKKKVSIGVVHKTLQENQ